MKRTLIFITLFLLLKNITIAQDIKNDNQLIYNYYTGTKKISLCYAIQNSFLSAFENDQLNSGYINYNLKLYVVSMDKIIDVAINNPLFNNNKSQITTYRAGWEEKTKPEILNLVGTNRPYKKGDLKTLIKSLNPLTDYVSNVYHATHDKFTPKFDQYNLNAINSLLNANSNSGIDTLTFKGFPIISTNPIILNAFDDDCKECLEIHYNGDIAAFKKFIPSAKVVSNENSTTFYTQGKNTITFEKIHKNPTQSAIILKVTPPN